jgi:Protein phosphatase 2C
MSKWRYTSSSVQGTSHIESGLPCQDSSLCRVLTSPNGDDFLILVASDGAGSASRSEEGSHILCQYFMVKLTRYIEQGWMQHQIDESRIRKSIEILTRHAAQTIKNLAKTQGVEKREFAATLVLAIVGQGKSIFSQIGDGGIVVNCDGGYDPVFWPQSGEYANMTYFITDDFAVKNLQFKVLNKVIDEIAVFTDGIQSLALEYQTQSAHTPFFRPQFEYLRQISEGDLPLLNGQLEGFLNSKPVNDRTNDDKTLILACRIEDHNDQEIYPENV